MNLLFSPLVHPLDNLALEAFLLRYRSDQWILLYRNQPCVVIGRHQNPLEEINSTTLDHHRLPWIRRLSGGGAVFHDLGNLNISFITPINAQWYNHYEPILQPLLDFLRSFNLPVRLTDRGDVLLHDRKISGNAQFTTLQRMLSHGTLLIQSDLTLLEQVLQPSVTILNSRARRSRPAAVANIRDFLSPPLPIEDFLEALIHHFQRSLSAQRRSIPEEFWNYHPVAIQQFSSFQWLYARTPPFTLRYLFQQQWYELTFRSGRVTNCQPHQPALYRSLATFITNPILSSPSQS